jgi:hypothetical protein
MFYYDSEIDIKNHLQGLVVEDIRIKENVVVISLHDQSDLIIDKTYGRLDVRIVSD